MTVYGFKDLETAKDLKNFAATIKGFGDDKITYPKPTFTIGGGGGTKIGKPKTDDHTTNTWHTYVVYELNESGVATAKSPEETVNVWQESGYTFSMDVLHHLFMVETAATTAGKKWIAHPHEMDDCNNTTVFTQGTGSALTISSGVISVTESFHTVDTEGGAATDDVDTINGGTLGMKVLFVSANSARNVVFKDQTGNLRCSADFTLSHPDDNIEFIWNGSVWLQTNQHNNT